MILLQSMKWRGESGDEELKVCHELTSDWKAVADTVGLSPSQQSVIEREQASNMDCVIKLFEMWLTVQSRVDWKYPGTWRGLCSLLSDIGKVSLKEDIQHALSFSSEFGKSSLLCI